MRKILLYLTIPFAIGACSGSGSSSDSPLIDDTVNTTTVAENLENAESTEEASTDVGSTDGTPMETGSTTGGETTGTGLGGQVTQYGFIGYDDYEEFVEIDASFISFGQGVDFPLFIDEIRPTSDSCEVTTVNLTDEIPDIPDDFGFDVNLIGFIGAGDVLTISSPAGSYAELLRNDQFGFPVYVLDDNAMLPKPAPSGLTVSIPGGEFPAFTNAKMPDLVPLQVISPSNFDAITASTTFSWNANPNTGSFVEISATAVSASGLVFVECLVLDDGSFTFPAQTQSQMGSFSGFGDMYRETLNVLQSGSSVLILNSSSTVDI